MMHDRRAASELRLHVDGAFAQSEGAGRRLRLLVRHRCLSVPAACKGNELLTDA